MTSIPHHLIDATVTLIREPRATLEAPAGSRGGCRYEASVARLRVAGVGTFEVRPDASLCWPGTEKLSLDLAADGQHPLDALASLSPARLSGTAWTSWPSLTRRFDSRLWRYARWVSCELPLSRGRFTIDLHWCLSSVRSAVPEFDDLWQRREQVKVSGRLLPTLGLADALDHSCVHSLKDQWRWIRSLVDVDRLARRLPVCGQQPPLGLSGPPPAPSALT